MGEGPRPSRVALVTGGGRGIGRALALGLAEHGVGVGLIGRHTATLDETAAQCAAAGVPSATAVGDVRDAESVRQAVDEVAGRLGPIDLLVNNAGVTDTEDTGFADADLDDVLRVVDVNLLGPMRVAHAVLPQMRAARHGRILNVNSGFAYRRGASMTGYGVSKAALGRFSDLLAHQLADEGVVVLDVSPGLVRTDMTLAMAMWQQMGDPPWGDPAAIVDIAVAMADGNLDALSGRFLHAAADDVQVLLQTLPADRDARTFGLHRYGPDDPLL